jgi:hypothetical protein
VPEPAEGPRDSRALGGQEFARPGRIHLATLADAFGAAVKLKAGSG